MNMDTAARDGGQRGEDRVRDAEEARIQDEGGGGGGDGGGAGAGIGTGAGIGGGGGEQAATASSPLVTMLVTPPERQEAPARTSSRCSGTSVAGTSSRFRSTVRVRVRVRVSLTLTVTLSTLTSDTSLATSSLSLATFNTISAQARKQQAAVSED